MSATRPCGSCGADSAASDYCDSCGASLDKSRVTRRADDAGEETPTGTEAPESADGPPAAETCPNCDAGRAPSAVFCEHCGQDFDEAHDARALWRAVVAADRAFFDSNRPAEGVEVTFPEDLPPSEVVLAGDKVAVGRSRRAGEDYPGIDVSRLTGDPGVSRHHAALVVQDDGSWAVTDTHSTNGTWVNAEPAPLEPDELIVLHDGDRINLGAFTSITVRRDVGAAS